MVYGDPVRIYYVNEVCFRGAVTIPGDPLPTETNALERMDTSELRGMTGSAEGDDAEQE